MDIVPIAVVAVLSFVLFVLVFLIMTKRWARRNRPLVISARVIACVIVQLLAIFAAAAALAEPGEETEFANLEAMFKANAAGFLIIFIIVLLDVIAVITIALVKSSWVEPLMR